jgi:predicted phosphodiesterase
MSTPDRSRRDVLKVCGLTAIASAMGCAPRGETAASARPFRFAVASDLHYRQKNTPFQRYLDDLVTWLNAEKEKKGLDVVFLNGDLVHDSTADYDALKKELERLPAPYYAIKGNHDFIHGPKGAPPQTWPTVWGYPSNHVVRMGRLAFVLADTSAPRNSRPYLAADIQWLEEQLARLGDAEAVFVLMHIAQRREGMKGWPGAGVKRGPEIEKGEKVMALLEATPNVRAVFHGHQHKVCARYQSDRVPYFFDSHVGGSFGNKRGYRIVEIAADGAMCTYQYNGEDGVVMNQHAL